jgi:hypothetical protein
MLVQAATKLALGVSLVATFADPAVGTIGELPLSSSPFAATSWLDCGCHFF